MGGSAVSKKMVRIAQAVVVACLVALGGATMAAPALAVNDGWNYIVVQNGNCGWRGGTITYVQGAVHGTDNYIQTWSHGDGGDNVVYAKVQRHLSNTFTGRAFCSNGKMSKWINVYKTFVPRPGQTVWL